MNLEKEMSQKASVNRVKAFLKVAAWVSAGLMLTTGLCWATLDGQVEKATNLVLGKVASLVVGGGTLFGGGYSIVQGNIGQGMAIIGVGALTGIGIALAKSEALFKVLS